MAEYQMDQAIMFIIVEIFFASCAILKIGKYYSEILLSAYEMKL